MSSCAHCLALPAARHSSLQARRAFSKLEQHGLRPSPASRAHLAAAQCAAGQWEDAVQEYDTLLRSG